MRGYKGVVLKNGVLRGKSDYIYEINLPAICDRLSQDDDNTNDWVQDTYFHFCKEIRGVFNWNNILIIYENNVCYDEYRIFEVEAADHIIDRNGMDYAANNLTLIREVSKEEIIDYINKGNISVSEKYFEKYKNENITPYENIIKNIQNIEIHLIEKCPYGSSCVSITKKIEECFLCDYYSCNGLALKKYLPDLYYNRLRVKVQYNQDFKNTEEYRYLVVNNKKAEIESLDRLYNWKKYQI